MPKENVYLVFYVFHLKARKNPFYPILTDINQNVSYKTEILMNF